ncbi:hypothetical protein LCGC14_0775390 [marine sediment metagenome]|uniref:Terminase large subunit gp17-like C-terminal domain-containing protein n=1 Tax=marine sediment metagenome TaxID=412755 RepID=A0A0F9Q1A1_9ZZZZ
MQVAVEDKVVIRPQPGPQEQFLSSSADIVFFGGQAGGGKSFGLELEPTRHIHNPGFGAVIFRKTSVQIRSEGGLWDTSEMIYPHLGGVPSESTLKWVFPSGVKFKFHHMEHEKNKHDHQGAQYPFVGFDELIHFSKGQFFYMLSRNRSVCGVRPYVRATGNPDPDSFVRELVDWWVDNDTGLPMLGQDRASGGGKLPNRSGVVRWFLHTNDELIWSDSWEDLVRRYGCKHQVDVLKYFMDFKTNELPSFAFCPTCNAPGVIPKSFTFIPSSIFDNPALLSKDPGYLANLRALSLVERERLLGGNWNVKAAAGMFFRKEWFEVVDAVPTGLRTVRYWDLAATDEKEGEDPSYTVGFKMGVDNQGTYYILDIYRQRVTALGAKRAMRNLATQDGRSCHVWVEQDPGQAGKAQVQDIIKYLAGFVCKANKVQESKGKRAGPFSAQCEAGNVKVLRAVWNEPMFREYENFDGTDKGHADQVDGGSGAFWALTKRKKAGAWGREVRVPA